MKKSKVDRKQSTTTSRRSMLKTASVAAIGMMLEPLAKAAPTTTPINYGSKQGQTPLDDTNMFPLLAAWLYLTTNINGGIDKDTIAKVYNISTDSAGIIFKEYQKLPQFGAIRNAFGEVVQQFTTSDSPYGTGQCPYGPQAFARVATLHGQPAPKSIQKSPK